MTWVFQENQKKHNQDGCQLAAIMKNQPLRKHLKAIDVGCGDGIIIHEMLRLNKATYVVGIDISKEAFRTATLNFVENKNVTILRKSALAYFRRRREWETFDCFVINPPFFKKGSGQVNQKNFDQLARHEGSLSLAIWAKGANKLLHTGGELYCVFPTERLSECLATLSKYKVEPKEIWWLKSDKRRRRFFLRAVKGGKSGLKVHF